MVKEEDFIGSKESKAVEYGEPVGVIAAQSMGEPSIQMVLRTFHSAGIASNISTGLPRIIEIVDARKKQASRTMRVNLDDNIKKDYSKVKKIAKSMQQVLVKDIGKRREDLKKSTMELTLDEDKLKGIGLTDEDVVSKLSKKFPTTLIKGNGNKIYFSYKKPKDLHSTRTAFVHILDFMISGVKDINKVVVMQDDDNSFYIFTSGSNISDVEKIEGVKENAVYSTDIFDVEKSYGIEAARNAIAYEINSTIEHEGTPVEFRHMALVADAMTVDGKIEGVGRQGLAGKKSSVFARAAYEETVKHFVNASIFGETDPLRGVSENVLIGKQIRVGTGLIKLGIKNSDLDKIKADE